MEAVTSSTSARTGKAETGSELVYMRGSRKSATPESGEIPAPSAPNVRADPPERCNQCLSQQRFAGTYASPNEDVMCGFHTSELRKELEAKDARIRSLEADLEEARELTFEFANALRAYGSVLIDYESGAQRPDPTIREIVERATAFFNDTIARTAAKKEG